MVHFFVAPYNRVLHPVYGKRIAELQNGASPAAI